MRAQAFLAGAMWLAGGLSAAAQDAPTFPASLERDSLLAWLQRETDVMPERVIAVTPQVVTSIVSTFPPGGGQGPRVVIRAEALSAETHERAGALSWHVSLSADCQGRRVRLGDTTGYPQRNLLGERRLLRPADTEWRAPEPGTALEFAWRAACDPQFKGPFQAARVKLAQPDAPLSTAPAPVTETSAPQLPPPQPGLPAGAEPAPPPATVKAAVSPPAPTRASGVVAQVGAVSTDADAQALLAGLEGSLGGRPTWVERAAVGGKTWWRAVVGGFADAAEATRFCADLKTAGRPCFVRPGRAP